MIIATSTVTGTTVIAITNRPSDTIALTLVLTLILTLILPLVRFISSVCEIDGSRNHARARARARVSTCSLAGNSSSSSTTACRRLTCARSKAGARTCVFVCHAKNLIRTRARPYSTRTRASTRARAMIRASTNPSIYVL